MKKEEGKDNIPKMTHFHVSGEKREGESEERGIR